MLQLIRHLLDYYFFFNLNKCLYYKAMAILSEVFEATEEDPGRY